MMHEGICNNLPARLGELLKYHRSWLFGLAATLFFNSSCTLHNPQKCSQDFADELNPEIFRQTLSHDFTPVQGTPKLVVYRCILPPADGDQGAAFNRPVLVLHEYDHLSVACLRFAERLSREGFTVYVPVLFGKTDGKSGLGTTIATTLELFMSSDWHALFGEHQHQPITDSLAVICRKISADHQHRGIGVIGMCLTGALPISLLSENCVVAPVIAQPSIPLFCFTPEGKRAPGISPTELFAAATRAKREHLQVFGTRYEKDSIGTKERFDSIHQAFGDDCFLDHTIAASDYLQPKWGLTDKAHATLTLCYKDGPDDYPPRHLFLDLVSFLKKHLDQHGNLSVTNQERVRQTWEPE
jgi:dienelactone hydrolase